MKNLIRIRFGIVFVGIGMGFILLGFSGCNDTGFSSHEGSSSTMVASQLDSHLDSHVDSHVEDRSHDSSEDCSGASGAQVMICHVPPGNPAARHTICVGIRGAQNGHEINLSDPAAIGGHGGDTLGACGAAPSEQLPASEPPAPEPSGTPSPLPIDPPEL